MTEQQSILCVTSTLTHIHIHKITIIHLFIQMMLQGSQNLQQKENRMRINFTVGKTEVN